MKYEDTPRPEIEHHYHIKELIEGQEKRVQERTYYRNKEKNKLEREDLIKDAKEIEIKEFWCDKCKLDFIQISRKQVEIDWSNPSQNIAFYKGKHKCGKWCIRLITDKHRDGYWIRSKKVVIDVGSHFADTIQPHETNFNLLYGKKL